MADHEDLGLDTEFAAFRDGLFAQVTPAGPDAVRATVRRRQRTRVIAAGALALALLTGPVAGYAALNPDLGPPPTPAHSTDPTVSPTPQATASSPAAATAATATTAAPAPGGRTVDPPLVSPPGPLQPSVPTEGPTTPKPNPDLTDLRITATDVVFPEATDSWRHATTTVTVRNAGPHDAEAVYLTFSFPGGLIRHEGSGWSVCTDVSDTADVPRGTLWCKFELLRSGEQRTLVLGLSTSLTYPDSEIGRVRADRNAGGEPVFDLADSDNTAFFSFR